MRLFFAIIVGIVGYTLPWYVCLLVVIIFSIRYIPYELVIIAMSIDSFSPDIPEIHFIAPYVLVALMILIARLFIQPFLTFKLTSS